MSNKEMNSKETFYAIGKVKGSSVSFWMNSSDALRSGELFTDNPEEAFTMRNSERMVSFRNRFDELKDLKVIEVTVETKKTYTFSKEI